MQILLEKPCHDGTTFFFSYCQAQIAAKEALSRLRDLGIPTERPDDYFAEMVKTDVHMQKVLIKVLFI